MKKKTIYLSVLAVFLTQINASAQEQQNEEVEQLDEVVLSDTKFELKKENSGKVIYKITKKIIQQNAGKTVIDLVDNIAGIEVSGNNNAAGSNIGIYIRGGRNRQVMIAIDGVVVSDPTGISSSYNLNLLDINQIESIEILKGSSSTLYGSGAASGVINVKLKKASKSPFALNYLASLGTNNTQRNTTSDLNNIQQNLGVRGTLNNFNYLISYSLAKEDGISNANDKNSPTFFETDAFLSNDLLIKFGYDAFEKLRLEVFGNYNQYDYDYDGGPYFDSDINNGSEEQSRIGVKADFNYKKGALKLIVSSGNLEREFDSYNGFSNAIDHYAYKGKSIYAEVINKYRFSENSSLILGLNYQDFSNQTNTPFGDIDKEIANYNTVDPFTSYLYTRGELNLNIGARLNNHSEYGSHLVYNLNPSYNLISSEETTFKVLGSYSTAFIAPSAYQLFSFYGNLDLNPEENLTTEFGFDTSYKNWLNASVVLFHREEVSTIIFVTDPVTFAGGYENAVDNQNAKGIETDVHIKATSFLNLNLNYTFTEKSADVDYIPKHKLVAGLGIIPFKKAFINLNFKSVGERTYFDQWGSFGAPAENVVLKSYSLVDLGMNYTINHLTLFGLLSNVFNEDYEDVLGYSTKGRNFKLGLKLNF